jgi:hypothetical protein
MQVVCPYCDIPADLLPDTAIYRVTYNGKIWLCRKCGAYVGCHKNGKGDKPLGRLANPGLRRMKMRGHELFDVFWRAAIKHRGWSKKKARVKAYRWLAREMKIPEAECHFGMMDPGRCSRAICILEEYHRKIKEKVA